MRFTLLTTVLVVTAALIIERQSMSHLRAMQETPAITIDAAAGANDNPAAAREQSITDFRRELAWIVVGTTMFAGVAVWLLLMPVATSVHELREAALANADGDLAVRADSTGDQEFSDIAGALRRMSTQLQTHHRTLELEERQLVALTESLHEGLIAIDAKHQVVRINETARLMLSLHEPSPFSADRLPRDATLRDAVGKVLLGQEQSGAQMLAGDRILSLAARPLPDGGGVLAFYDLTQFRRLEAVRRDFVANVSHELRTPLTVVRGAVETLQDDNMPATVRQHFLTMAESNVLRMQRIVDDLLDLSRIESGGWLPNPVQQDLPALAEQITATLGDAARLKGVELRTDFAADACTLYADATACLQILSNLAENALRHTASGEVVIFSTATRSGVWLGVRDTGEGMDAVHVPRIFERFYRADSSRSRAGGGTGLGLAIVRHLTEAHGGSVRAASVVGQGTTITAFFPYASGERTS